MYGDKINKWITVDEFCKKHPVFTMNRMRWLLFKRDENGLSAAVSRMSRRLLIDEDRFLEWLESHREGEA